MMGWGGLSNNSWTNMFSSVLVRAVKLGQEFVPKRITVLASKFNRNGDYWSDAVEISRKLYGFVLWYFGVAAHYHMGLACKKILESGTGLYVLKNSILLSDLSIPHCWSLYWDVYQCECILVWRFGVSFSILQFAMTWPMSFFMPFQQKVTLILL